MDGFQVRELLPTPELSAADTETVILPAEKHTQKGRGTQQLFNGSSMGWCWTRDEGYYLLLMPLKRQGEREYNYPNDCFLPDTKTNSPTLVSNAKGSLTIGLCPHLKAVTALNSMGPALLAKGTNLRQLL